MKFLRDLQLLNEMKENLILLTEDEINDLNMLTEEKIQLLDEKWAKKVVVAKEERGKYKGWTLSKLRSTYNKMKKMKDKAKEEVSRMRELAFAIRSKTGWGKVGA